MSLLVTGKRMQPWVAERRAAHAFPRLFPLLIASQIMKSAVAVCPVVFVRELLMNAGSGDTAI